MPFISYLFHRKYISVRLFYAISYILVSVLIFCAFVYRPALNIGIERFKYLFVTKEIRQDLRFLEMAGLVKYGKNVLSQPLFDYYTNITHDYLLNHVLNRQAIKTAIQGRNSTSSNNSLKGASYGIKMFNISNFAFIMEPNTTTLFHNGQAGVYHLSKQFLAQSIISLGSSELHDDNYYHLHALNAGQELCFVLALIPSSPDNFDRRQNIRKTWAKARVWIDTGLTYYLMPLFLIGQPSNLLEKEDYINDRLADESLSYGDIVQGNYVDTYANLTYKSMSGILYALAFAHKYRHWLENFDRSFVFKVDDDTFPNLPRMLKASRLTVRQLRDPDTIIRGTIPHPTKMKNDTIPIFCRTFTGWAKNSTYKNYTSLYDSSYLLISLLCANISTLSEGLGESTAPNKNSVSKKPIEYVKLFPYIAGMAMTGYIPIRAPEHRNYVSKEDFPDDYYPPYRSGAGYLINLDLYTLKSLYHQSFNTPFLVNEDIYVTGLLSRKAEVSLIAINFDEFVAETPNNSQFYEAHSLFKHRKSDLQYEEIWRLAKYKSINITQQGHINVLENHE